MDVAIHRYSIYKFPLGWVMTGNNSTDRSKLGTKRHILTDKQGIPLSAAISSASTQDIKAVTNVIDNAVIKRPTTTASTFISTTKQRMAHQHLCLDGDIILNH
jgi:Transposase DDE domain